MSKNINGFVGSICNLFAHIHDFAVATSASPVLSIEQDGVVLKESDTWDIYSMARTIRSLLGESDVGKELAMRCAVCLDYMSTLTLDASVEWESLHVQLRKPEYTTHPVVAILRDKEGNESTLYCGSKDKLPLRLVMNPKHQLFGEFDPILHFRLTGVPLLHTAVVENRLPNVAIPEVWKQMLERAIPCMDCREKQFVNAKQSKFETIVVEMMKKGKTLDDYVFATSFIENDDSGEEYTCSAACGYIIVSEKE